MGTWSWEIELEVPDTTNQRVINFNNNNFRYLRANSGFWDLNNNLAGLPNVTSTTPVTVNTRTVIRVEATADEVSWFIDGTPQGVIGTQTNDFILNNLNNTANFTGKVYRFEVWENGILVESRVKQTLTSGNDRVYTDNVGTNDGALDATFPADNSQWELFDAAAGVTADVAYTVSAPTFSASASATIPAPNADVSFSIPSPQFSASASVTQPGFSADVSFLLQKPQFSASASVTLPSPQADVSYEIGKPQFSANASASLPQSVADVDFSLQAPVFSASASVTIDGRVADVGFSIGKPVFSASASVTLPNPVADVAFTISPPIFSVVAISGSAAIIADDETNINMPSLSTNVEMPWLSTNINR